MKVKYRIVIEIESDTETEAPPDQWDWDVLLDAPTELIRYKDLGPVDNKKNASAK